MEVGGELPSGHDIAGGLGCQVGDIAPFLDFPGSAFDADAVDAGVQQGNGARGMQGQAARMAPDDVESAAVGDREDAFVVMTLGDVVDGGDDAGLELHQRFAAFDGECGILPVACGSGLGSEFVDAIEVQPLENAKSTFAQAGFGTDTQAELGGERFSGAMGASQVTAVECVEGLVDGCHVYGELPGLFLADGVKFDVLPALQAARMIPGGFAVADEPDFSHGARRDYAEARAAGWCQGIKRESLTR